MFMFSAVVSLLLCAAGPGSPASGTPRSGGPACRRPELYGYFCL